MLSFSGVRPRARWSRGLPHFLGVSCNPLYHARRESVPRNQRRAVLHFAPWERRDLAAAFFSIGSKCFSSGFVHMAIRRRGACRGRSRRSVARTSSTSHCCPSSTCDQRPSGSRAFCRPARRAATSRSISAWLHPLLKRCHDHRLRATVPAPGCPAFHSCSSALCHCRQTSKHRRRTCQGLAPSGKALATMPMGSEELA